MVAMPTYMNHLCDKSTIYDRFALHLSDALCSPLRQGNVKVTGETTRYVH